MRSNRMYEQVMTFCRRKYLPKVFTPISTLCHPGRATKPSGGHALLSPELFLGFLFCVVLGASLFYPRSMGTSTECVV